ncbi:MAG: 16S rRNA (uracil(1498)-N(3))-methyltransferase [Kiloniellales bacterium]
MAKRVKARLYVEADLNEGGTVGASPGQAHYLKSVLRLGRGDPVALFNGRDGEWIADIDGIGKGWASLALVGRQRRQTAEPDLWLVFAPIKRARIDFLAQKATEFGVSALWPVFTGLTQVSRVNEDRLLANAVEAAEQSGRLSVPRVLPAATLDAALARWPHERRLLWCAEQGPATPIAEALAGASAAAPWAVLTGPEGGFTAAELDALGKLPFVTAVGLGPRLLRADTAALAALACWQALAGDGCDRPPPGHADDP